MLKSKHYREFIVKLRQLRDLGVRVTMTRPEKMSANDGWYYERSIDYTLPTGELLYGKVLYKPREDSEVRDCIGELRLWAGTGDYTGPANILFREFGKPDLPCSNWDHFVIYMLGKKVT